MELTSQVFEVNRDNFEEAVLAASRERVIVVDFWAPWCGPCKTLSPLLEEVVRELGPGIALAKVNVDENQELAMAFRVQSIPAVKVVSDGQLVQEFTGALPRQQIVEILKPLVPEATTEEDDQKERAEALEAMGDLDGAAAVYEATLQGDPEQGAAALALARIRLRQGDVAAVHDLVDRIDETEPEYNAAQALLTQFEFVKVCTESGGRAACAQKMLASPDDLDARYSFACCAAIEGEYEAALKEWLAIVEQKRDFRDGAAKDAMVAVFHLLGRENDLVADYQRRLYQVLY